jgi:histidine triad (HIT) family protein
MGTAWSHEPAGYDCPFCRMQTGLVDERNQPTDVVAVTGLAFARISPTWWPDNPGAALVIPRQHNEPAGNQDVWHLHVHVFPRDADDRLYVRHRESAYVDAAARAPYADRLADEIGLPRTFR